MTLYLDVGVVRIQEYLTRTSGADEGQLRRRRGASRMVSAATDAANFSCLGLAPNLEAYHVEGVVHLKADDESAAGPSLADRAARQLRRQLPQAYLSASWAFADNYAAAHTLLESARRGRVTSGRSGTLEVLPPLREDPFAARCKGCGLAPATERELCLDCSERDRAGGATSNVATPESRALAAVSKLADRRLSPVKDLSTLAGLPVAAHEKSNHLATVYADGNGMGRLFAGIHDRETARLLSTDVDEAIRAAGAQALHDLLPYCTPGVLPGVLTVLAADDALITVPAPLAWPFARTLISVFAERMAASDVAGSLTDEAGASIPCPSLTVGITFSQVKSPIETAIRTADDAMRRAKQEHPGVAAVGWDDLTHPTATTTRPVTADWLEQQQELVEAMVRVPGSGRQGWERVIRDADWGHVDDARLRQFLRHEFDRLGHHVLSDADLAGPEVATLIDLARWWPPEQNVNGDGPDRHPAAGDSFPGPDGGGTA